MWAAEGDQGRPLLTLAHTLLNATLVYAPPTTQDRGSPDAERQ